MLYGIIGLFVGAVVLSLFYKLLGLWLLQEAQHLNPGEDL